MLLDTQEIREEASRRSKPVRLLTPAGIADMLSDIEWLRISVFELCAEIDRLKGLSTSERGSTNA